MNTTQLQQPGASAEGGQTYILPYVVILKLALVSLLLTPSLGILPGVPTIRLDDLVLLGFFGWLLFFKPELPPVLVNLRTASLLALGLLLVISSANGALNGFEVSFADLNQFTRFIKYAAMYALAALAIASCGKGDIKRLIKFTCWVGLGLFAITLSQYFNPFGINSHYVMHVAPTQYQTLVGNYPFPRPVGMIGNPNELGFMFALLAMLAIFSAEHYSNKMYLILALVFAMGVFFTLSRSSVVALVAGFMAFYGYLIIGGREEGRVKRLLITLSIVVIFLGIVNIPVVYDAFTWRIVRIFNIASDTSTQARFDNWSENIRIIEQHYALGVGPLRRADLQHAADNEWLLIWRSYGLVGIAVIVALFAAGLTKATKKNFTALRFALVGACFVYMIPAAVFHSLVLFPLVLFVFALIDIEGRRP